MSKSLCTITIHSEGRAGAAARLDGARHELTVELESTFDDKFVTALKRIPWTDRAWDGEARRWWFPPRRLDEVTALALAFYSEVFVVEGSVTTNVRTGQAFVQESLF